MNSSLYQHLANAVLILHVSIVLFIIVGLVLILAGGLLRWAWVRNPWFRLAHLGAIGVVVAEAWLGIVCPLTTLEQWLREQAGQTAYSGDFIGHWLRTLLYFDLPPWVFIAMYSGFGLIVAGSWPLVRPRRLW